MISWKKLIVVSAFLLVVLLTVVITIALTKSSICKLEAIGEEEISLVEDEFLFSLPEGSNIEPVIYIKSFARGKVASCNIICNVSKEELAEKYLRFKLGKMVKEYPETYQAEGLIEDDDIFFTIEFSRNEEDGFTKARIEKVDGINVKLFEKMIKNIINDMPNSLPSGITKTRPMT